MQWVLQDFEDTTKLAAALNRLGLSYSWHKVVPFIGELVPKPDIPDPSSVVMFGAYSLWRYAEANGLWPGVFKLNPFLHEAAWQAHLLNGPGAIIATVAQLPDRLWTMDLSGSCARWTTAKNWRELSNPRAKFFG
jgi:hypothetical protein